MGVGILCTYHLWSLVSNTSTIEVWEQEKVEAMIKKGKLRKVSNKNESNSVPHLPPPIPSSLPLIEHGSSA